MSIQSGGLRLATAAPWQEQLRDAIRSPAALAEAVGLAPAALPFDAAASADFPLLVPRSFAARMRRGDADDPLLRQVLASAAETRTVEGYGPDPLQELSLPARDQGVLKKYHGRALLITTGACAVNCRYCFRRHFPYQESTGSHRERLQRVSALAGDPTLKELILSGGDPLLLTDRQLAEIVDIADASEHLGTLRLHSRLPIVIPDRVTQTLLAALRRPALRSVMVLHCNHAREIDSATAAAIARLRDAGVLVLNQSVLLAGVNDSVADLEALSLALFDAGALPYYLHMLDPVAGAAHFAVEVDRARHLLGALAGRLPGYLLPRLAVEVAGADSKRELAPAYTPAPKKAQDDL
jgi:EF-P beta-lysylation protein EpmB